APGHVAACFCVRVLRPAGFTLFPYTTLFRSESRRAPRVAGAFDIDDAVASQRATGPIEVAVHRQSAGGVAPAGQCAARLTDVGEIGRAHVRTPVTVRARIASSACRANRGSEI